VLRVVRAGEKHGFVRRWRGTIGKKPVHCSLVLRKDGVTKFTGPDTDIANRRGGREGVKEVFNKRQLVGKKKVRVSGTSRGTLNLRETGSR